MMQEVGITTLLSDGNKTRQVRLGLRGFGANPKKQVQ
jgi:hypothetical protein